MVGILLFRFIIFSRLFIVFVIVVVVSAAASVVIVVLFISQSFPCTFMSSRNLFPVYHVTDMIKRDW